jgi:rare lipoprotein A
MYGMTAAHPTLPIPSYARITNVATKKSVIVRVNDRGPFLHDRIIDLSYTAAHKLGVINNGSAQVLVESLAVDGSEALTVSTVLPTPIKSEPLTAELSPPIVVVPEVPKSAVLPVNSTKAATVAAAGNIYLQLGAFKSTQGAESFLAKMQSKLGDGGKSLSLYQKDGLERVHLGPYTTHDEARAAAEKLKTQLGIKPFVSTR